MLPHELVWMCDSFLTVMGDYELSDEQKLGIAREFRAALPQAEWHSNVKVTLQGIRQIMNEHIEELNGRVEKDRRKEAANKAREEGHNEQAGSSGAELPTDTVGKGQPRESSGSAAKNARKTGPKARSA